MKWGRPPTPPPFLRETPMLSGWLLPLGIDLVERGWVADGLVRTAIRRLCAAPTVAEGAAEDAAADREFARWLRSRPIAESTHDANAQHYELPAEFFGAWLGPRHKYSCCWWGDGVTTLAQAEDAALAETCRRAELADGQAILELGCGWGSLSLWMAEHYPQSRITAVSNSASQRAYIERVARERGFDRLQVVTADINQFETDTVFDRVVTVEMLEHVRNYERLFERIRRWLRPDGKLFAHIFCRRRRAYAFETEGPANWMGRNFFTGGIMPSLGLFREFTAHLEPGATWEWNGRHYQRTAESWLANYDQASDSILALLRQVYGPESKRRFHRWRIFLLAVAEMFGLHRGEESLVAHYLLEPVKAPRRLSPAADLAVYR
jgi:cyclopropane-fatty-acyl-phospholipid synthase